MDKILKIGTRDSPLALWQAESVQRLLSEHRINSEIIAVKSEGDLDLVTPLYEMGVQGVFTRTLDAYLLSGHIDIAVHSMKDVPVQLAQGLREAAVLERAQPYDVIVWKDKVHEHDLLSDTLCTIGTGSIRRKSQWLHRFPHHKIDNLRGNVQTRIRKLNESNWIGAIFAAAGLGRMNMDELNSEKLDWMIPAPAQGAILVVCREKDSDIFQSVNLLNHEQTETCVQAEREFLRHLHGGCSAPIGAHMYTENGRWFFTGCVCSIDGSNMISVYEEVDIHSGFIGKRMSDILYSRGAQKIIEEIRGSKI